MKKAIPLLLFALCLFASPTTAQVRSKKTVREEEASRQVAESPLHYLGPFRINGEPPAGLNNISTFFLNFKSEEDETKFNRSALVPDRQGQIPVRGWLTTRKGTVLEFVDVRLVETGPVKIVYETTGATRVMRSKPIALSFTTAEIKGYKYSFRGEYLEEPAEEGEGYSYLKGTLSKFRKGELVAESRVSFTLSPVE